MRAWLLIALLVAAASLASCDNAPRTIQPRHLAGGTDVTFFVAADAHFGAEGVEAINRRQVEQMNSLPGTPYPDALGGVVAAPRGVLFAGDMTDNGLPDNWKLFEKYYGLTGKEGLLHYPVFECTGNHDRIIPLNFTVTQAVRRRHGSLARSWDWADVHVVCLDEYPSAANVAFLKRDLAAVGKERPVVIYFHFNLAGPFSSFWSQSEKDNFRKAIEGYNVVGIFHGHWHLSLHYAWSWYDAFQAGSPRHNSHRFLVVHITDTRMTVASWDYDDQAWGWAFSKAINAAKLTAQPTK